jgi:hypothetical protein
MDMLKTVLLSKALVKFITCKADEEGILNLDPSWNGGAEQLIGLREQ